MQIKAVIYDVDGTLINSEPLHVLAWDNAMQKYGGKLSNLPDAFQASMAGRKPSEIASDIASLETLPVTGAELLHTKAEMLLSAIEKGVAEMPGAVASVKRFHEAGMLLGIGAALDREYVDLVLAKLGISSMFTVIVTGDRIKKGKPDPETYSTAVRELGLKPSECVVFEDAKSGIASAKNAGCYCIAINNSSAQDQDTSLADRIVTSWHYVTIATLEALVPPASTVVVTARKSDWDQAQETGEYTLSTIDSTLERVGFIHCSFPEQVMDMVNRKYQSEDDLLLLFIRPDKVESEIKYEGALSGRAGVFPHIYGPLNTNAVFAVAHLNKINGKFIQPKELVEQGSAEA